jgi:hypothetical protein
VFIGNFPRERERAKKKKKWGCCSEGLGGEREKNVGTQREGSGRFFFFSGKIGT